jgi:hypothetical protein
MLYWHCCANVLHMHGPLANTTHNHSLIIFLLDISKSATSSLHWLVYCNAATPQKTCFLKISELAKHHKLEHSSASSIIQTCINLFLHMLVAPNSYTMIRQQVPLGISPTVNHIIGDIPYVLSLCTGISPIVNHIIGDIPHILLLCTGISPTVNHVIGDIPHVLLLCMGISPTVNHIIGDIPHVLLLCTGISPTVNHVIGDIPHVLLLCTGISPTVNHIIGDNPHVLLLCMGISPICYSAVWEYPTQLICVIGDKVMSLGISHDTIDDIPCLPLCYMGIFITYC